MKYHLWLTRRDDGEAFYIEVRATGHGAALWAAETLAASLSDHYECYRLWADKQLLIDGETVNSRFCLNTALAIPADTQQCVLDATEGLLPRVRSGRLHRAAELLRSLPKERIQ